MEKMKNDHVENHRMIEVCLILWSLELKGEYFKCHDIILNANQMLLEKFSSILVL